MSETTNFIEKYATSMIKNINKELEKIFEKGLEIFVIGTHGRFSPALCSVWTHENPKIYNEIGKLFSELVKVSSNFDDAFFFEKNPGRQIEWHIKDYEFLEAIQDLYIEMKEKEND